MSVAVIQGAGGGIAQALTAHVLRNTGLKVYALTHGKASALQEKLGGGSEDRLSVLDGVDVTDEETVYRAAEEVKKREGKGTVRLIGCFAGILHPEKSLGGIKYDAALDTFKINALGHLITYKHFVPLLPTGKEFKEHQESWKGDDPAQGLVGEDNALCWSMSARVGSIEGNEKGGWYSYRSSKAALNQIIRSLDHELVNKSSSAVAVGYHPGTVLTSFSKSVLGQNIKPDPKNGRFEVDEALRHLIEVMGKQQQQLRVLWEDTKQNMQGPTPTPTNLLNTVLRAINTTPALAAASLLRRIDLPGPIGEVTKAVGGAAETVIDTGSQAANTANDIKETADQLNAAKAKFDYYYGLWQKYKDLIYLALAIFAIILVMCFVNCAIQWCRNCCCCVKIGYKCTKWGCTGLGWCCIQTKHCVCGLKQAMEDAERLGKHYDGIDPTGCRRHLMGGMRLPDDPKEAAHQMWYGDARGWFGQNVARIWGGHVSRVVRHVGETGKVVYYQWDAEGNMRKYKKVRGKAEGVWKTVKKTAQKEYESMLQKRGFAPHRRPEDVEKGEVPPTPPPAYNDAAAQKETGVRGEKQSRMGDE